MMAVSSHRPLKDSFEVARNQLRARDSWLSVFERITYLGPRQESLSAAGVRFVPSSPFPYIRQLVSICALQEGWSAIINADIVVSPKLPVVEMALSKRRATTAISLRHEFRNENIDAAIVTDAGLDFFAAIQPVWQRCAKEFPDWLRIGSPGWDPVMLCFFMSNYVQSCYDLTPSRLIFHPLHGDRKHQPVSGDQTSRYFGGSGWPPLRLKI